MGFLTLNGSRASLHGLGSGKVCYKLGIDIEQEVCKHSMALYSLLEIHFLARYIITLFYY